VAIHVGTGGTSLPSLVRRGGATPRAILLSRALYQEAGSANDGGPTAGYWELLIRLSCLDGVRWVRSDAPIGAIAAVMPGVAWERARDVIHVLARTRAAIGGDDASFNVLAMSALRATGWPGVDRTRLALSERPWMLSVEGSVFSTREFLAGSSAEVAAWLAGE
jgi:hypothetical protein